MKNTENTQSKTLTCRQAVEILESHSRDINSFGVEHISLFGSVARGECGPQSDVDILVEFTHTTYNSFKEMKAYLEDIFNRKVDLVTLPSVKGRFEDQIKGELVDVKTK